MARLCEMISEFSSGHIYACYLGLGHFHLDSAYLQMQTHLVPKIMHQKEPYFYCCYIMPNWANIIDPMILIRTPT